MFSKPQKPVEEPSPQDEETVNKSLIEKVKAILDEMTEQDYNIEMVISADGKPQQKLIINGKFLTDNLEKQQFRHPFKHLQHLIVTQYTYFTAMDFIFAKESEREKPIVTYFITRSGKVAKQ